MSGQATTTTAATEPTQPGTNADGVTPARLAEIRNLSRHQLAQMAEKARALARPEATAAVAKACEELAT